MSLFFFFNDTATTEIYTFPTRRSSDLHEQVGERRLSLPEACLASRLLHNLGFASGFSGDDAHGLLRSEDVSPGDRKSTRLNSSHANISYAVFCLKKTKQ